MKAKKVSDAEIAAYNHGYCYCITYCARNSININDLNEKSSFYYKKNNLRSMFESGYMIALNDINSGYLTACHLGERINDCPRTL